MLNMNKKFEIDFRYAPEVNQTCIGLVDDKYKTIVREDGSLNYLWESDQNQFVDGTIEPCTKRILSRQEGNLGFAYRFIPRFSHRDNIIRTTQDFGDSRAAIVYTKEEYKDTCFSWKTFAYQHPDGTRMDIILYRLEAGPNFGHADSVVYLQELGQAADSPCVQRFTSGAYTLPVGTEKTPPPIAFATKHVQRRLVGNDVWEGAFGLLYQGSFSEASFTLEFARQALRWCETYWASVKPFLHTFTVPDPQIQHMLSAAGRNILQAREMVDGILEFHVGPTIYRGLWVVDGYYFAECAYLMGRDQEAFDVLLSILRRQKPDGSIRILPDHHKETAVAISNIVRQCELRNDDERLKEYWPLILRGIHHLKEMRDASYSLDASYPARGLFLPSFGDGGIYGPEPEYTTPMNVILGLNDAYRAGSRLALPHVEAIRQFSEELMEVMQKCIERDRKVTDQGIPYLPLSMASEHTYKPQAGSATIARVAFHEVFPPESRIVQDLLALVDSIDDEQGIPYGTGWRPDQSLYVYASVRFAQLMIVAGQPQKAIEYVYAFANHASASRVWREEQPLKGTHSSEICGDMPHNWASVEFIRLVRNLVLTERNEGLLLLPALPETWLPTEEHVLKFEKTPTKFGKIDVCMEKLGEKRYKLTFCREPGNQEPSYITLTWNGKVTGPVRSIGDNTYSIAVDARQETFLVLLV